MAAFILRYYLVVFLSESMDNANRPMKIHARAMLKTRIEMLRKANPGRRIRDDPLRLRLPARRWIASRTHVLARHSAFGRSRCSLCRRLEEQFALIL
jgi:hypothetical protein